MVNNISYLYRNYSVFIILFLISTCTLYCQNNKIIDSIVQLRQLSQNKELNEDTRVEYALEAVKLSKETNLDSTLIMSNRILSFLYLNIDRYEEYRKINLENKKLTLTANDSLSYSIAFENLGYYHYYYENIDSAFYYYYNSAKIFDKLKQEKKLAGVLLNLAEIQDREKDFVGAEATAIKALEIYIKLPESEIILDDQWILFNQLGVLYKELKQYDKALDYHNNAIVISEKMDNGVYNKLYSLSNKASVFREIEEHETSLKLYNEILETKGLYKFDPSFYASVINNIAYTKLLSGNNNYDQIQKELFNSKRICDSIDDEIGVLDVSYKIAELFHKQKKNDSANKYAKEALKLAEGTNSNKSVLLSLMLLSKVNDGDRAKKYLYRHIKLNDSLLNNERAARNKFASIRFETNEIKAENEAISRRNQWLIGLSGGLLLTSLLVYIIISQRAKNKELRFIQQQQEANEEIYNLMLEQQNKVDEGRAKEKTRISEELHDGVLSRLFGTRLSLDSINMVNTEEAIKNRGNYINELKTIEQEIRKISHDLNTDFIANSGFLDIVETLIETQAAAYQLTYEFEHSEVIDWDEVSNKNKIHLYRIIQESLQNIYKHAKASHVKIGFQLKNDVILVSIEDDGSGFDTNKAKKGIGLKNINSRVLELNGELTINSKPGKGTDILINVPI